MPPLDNVLFVVAREQLLMGRERVDDRLEQGGGETSAPEVTVITGTVNAERRSVNPT